MTFLSPRLEMLVSWRVIFWSITWNCVLQQKPPEIVQYRNRAADCLSWLGHTTCLSGLLPLFAEVGRCEKTVVIKWEPFFRGDQFFSTNVWVNLEGFPLVHWFLAGVIHIMTHEKPLGIAWQLQTSKINDYEQILKKWSLFYNKCNRETPPVSQPLYTVIWRLLDLLDSN